MIQAAIAGFFVWLTLYFLEKDQDRGIDGWVSVVFVLVPALMIFLISLAIGFLGLPQWLVLLSVVLYFLVPALMLKFQFELPWSRSCAYGGIVFAIAIVVDVALSYGFAALSA